MQTQWQIICGKEVKIAEGFSSHDALRAAYPDFKWIICVRYWGKERYIYSGEDGWADVSEIFPWMEEEEC